MTPTNDQIVAEAQRRRDAVDAEQRWPLEDYVIDVVREGWTPPKPVDPDLLIAREAAAQQWEQHYGDKIEAQRRRDGWCDTGQAVTACRIAARMATDRERERAKVLLECLDNLRQFSGWADGQRAAQTLAKYRGEA